MSIKSSNYGLPSKHGFQIVKVTETNEAGEVISIHYEVWRNGIKINSNFSDPSEAEKLIEEMENEIEDEISPPKPWGPSLG